MALACSKFISGTKLDDRIIRCEMDSGFIPGREFGRGASGGQVRDERRTDYDAGRGGAGSMTVIGANVGLGAAAPRAGGAAEPAADNEMEAQVSLARRADPDPDSGAPCESFKRNLRRPLVWRWGARARVGGWG